MAAGQAAARRIHHSGGRWLPAALAPGRGHHARGHPGTGAVGAAVSAVLRGVESPVAVRLDGGELEVEVGEDMHVNLTGWAVPIIIGTLSEDLERDLEAL